jgi:hypothetical protein
LSDRRGHALFIGTPKGFNHFYDLFQNAGGQPDWAAFQFTTEQGGNVAREELESAAGEMDERTYRQEFQARFENLAHGRVYFAFERSENVQPAAYWRQYPRCWALDFNVNPMCSIIAQIEDRSTRLDQFNGIRVGTTASDGYVTFRRPSQFCRVIPLLTPPSYMFTGWVAYLWAGLAASAINAGPHKCGRSGISLCAVRAAVAISKQRRAGRMTPTRTAGSTSDVAPPYRNLFALQAQLLGHPSDRADPELTSSRCALICLRRGTRDRMTRSLFINV